MPDWELSWLKNMHTVDPRGAEASIHYKTKNHDIQKRLNLLFGPNDQEKGVFDDVDEDDYGLGGSKVLKGEDKEAAEAGYKTVNEGATTDTALDTDYVNEVENQAKPKKQVMKMVKKIKEKRVDPKFDSGIQSDDEDEPVMAAQDSVSEYEEMMVTASSSDNEFDAANSQNDTKKQRDIDSYRKRDAAENRFKFSEEDLQKFTEIVKDKQFGTQKYDAKEQDFLGTMSLEEEIKNLDASTGDMQNLNLFGVSMDIQVDDSTVMDEQTQQIISDLVQLSQKIDPLGVSADFTKRKSFTYYDPYNEEANASSSMQSWGREEDIYRASLVVNQFKTQFKHLNSRITSKGLKLSFIDKERLKQTDMLLERLGKVKIVDAPVLLKLYDLYRYKPDE